LCNLPGALTAQDLQALPTIGISVNGYAALLTISLAIITAIWCAVGFLIFWRRSDDWLALLAAFFLVMFNITNSGNSASALALAYPILALPLSLVNFLGQVSLLVFFLLFPNGRLVPRWIGLFLLLAILADLPRPPEAAARPVGTSAAALASWVERRGIAAAMAPNALQGIVLWSRLHGLVSLEIDGNYASIGLDPGPLYATEVADVPLTYPVS